MTDQKKTITPTSPAQHGRGIIPAPQGISQPLAMANNQGETAALAMAAKQKALVEARFTLAQHRPRDLDAVREKLLKECKRPAFARGALYLKPVGEGITGLSIRFVEAAIAAMGNIYSDVSTIHEDIDKRLIHVEVTDAETNVAHSTEIAVHKTVERSSVRDGDEVLRQRTNSRGRTTYTKRATDDEILNTVNLLVSKAIRTNGLRLVPVWLRDECEEVIRITMENENAQDPDAAKRRLFDAFAALGVGVPALKEWLGHDGVTLLPAERTALLGIYNALKDGETTWAEVMDNRDAGRAKAAKPVKPDDASAATTAKGAAGLKKRAQAARQQQAAAAAPESAAQDPRQTTIPGTTPADWGLDGDGDEREPGEEG